MRKPLISIVLLAPRTAVVLALLAACTNGLEPDGSDRPPLQSSTLKILTPLDGAVIDYGAPLGFSSAPPESNGRAPVWTSDRDGEIGTGSSFHNEGLSVGPHLIKAAYSATEYADVRITISAPAVAAGGELMAADFSGCKPGQVPEWFAFQDGDGLWTGVAGRDGVYEFAVASAKGGYAFRTAAGFIHAQLATRAEMSDLVKQVCAETGVKQVSGSVVGADKNDVQVGMGEGLGGEPAVTPQSFTLTGVPEGRQDLVAYLRATLAGDDRAIIRRDMDVPDRGTLATLDFGGPEAFTAASATLAVRQRVPVQFAVGYLAGPACASYYLGASSVYDPARERPGFTIRGIPAEKQRPTDFHQVWVSTSDAASSREMLESFHRFGDRTVSLPTPVPNPVITVLPGSYKRIQAALSLPPEYQKSVWLWYGWPAQGVVMGVNATFGWLGGSNVSLAIPNFSSAAGWRGTFLPGPGVRVQWMVTAMGATYAEPAGACSENARSYIAHVHGLVD